MESVRRSFTEEYSRTPMPWRGMKIKNLLFYLDITEKEESQRNK